MEWFVVEVATNDKYAIIETGGKQYQAIVGSTLAIEKIDGEPGDKISFDKVLLLKESDGSCAVGAPFFEGKLVKASIVKQEKGPKLIIFKFKRRGGNRTKKGHRQKLTVVRFEEI
jgi:large subunit ribosomal protein L21